MKLEDQSLLSNYEPLTSLDPNQNVWLVRDVRNGKIFVRKNVVCNSPQIYHYLQKANIDGIPEIYHIFSDKDNVILIEQYIHGETATEHFHNKEFLEDEIIAMGLDICSTLSKLHHLNPKIICRDIKPSNLMIQSGKWYITDFNIARSFEPNQNQDTDLLGTASFAPPEQYGFGQTDERSDIYALAVTMNVLLTGHFPSEKITNGCLNDIITRATKIDPKDRYQNAAELSSALRSISKDMSKPELKTLLSTRLKRKSTWIAFSIYLLWAIFIIRFSGETLIDNKPATPFQEAISNLSIFLVTFLPYFYNANYFNLLGITLGDYEYKSRKYWAMRIIYTILISIGIPLVLVSIFL